MCLCFEIIELKIIDNSTWCFTFRSVSATESTEWTKQKKNTSILMVVRCVRFHKWNHLKLYVGFGCHMIKIPQTGKSIHFEVFAHVSSSLSLFRVCECGRALFVFVYRHILCAYIPSKTHLGAQMIDCYGIKTHTRTQNENERCMKN